MIFFKEVSIFVCEMFCMNYYFSVRRQYTIEKMVRDMEAKYRFPTALHIESCLGAWHIII